MITSSSHSNQDNGNYDLFFLLAGHAAIFWLIALFNLPITHDTFINFQLFVQLYSGYLFNGEFPLWMPYTAHGITTDFAYVVTFTPAFYISTFLGGLASVEDTVLLFRFGVYLEEAIYVFGIFKLSELLHQERITRLVLSITGALSTYWILQIHWDFHLIYFIPLIGYCGIRYLRGGGMEWAALAVLVFTLGGIFYPRVFLALFFMVFVVAWFIVFRPSISSLFRFALPIPVGVLILGLAAMIAILNATFSWHSIDGMNAREASSLAEFLTYGGQISLSKFNELLSGVTSTHDFHMYAGLPTIIFVLAAVHASKQREILVFVFLAIFVILFSLGENSFVAAWTYHFFPAMDRFRHVGYVGPVLKVVLIVLSGYGIDWLFRHKLSITKLKFLINTSIWLLLIFLVFIFRPGESMFYGSNDWVHYPPQYWSNYSGFWDWFWLSQFSIWIIFLLAFWMMRNRKNIVHWTLIATVLTSMGVYKYQLEWNGPASAAFFTEKWQTTKEQMSAKQLPYIASRDRGYRGIYDPSFFSSANPVVAERLQALDNWGAPNAFGYGSAHVDLCLPISRTDLISKHLINYIFPMSSLLPARGEGSLSMSDPDCANGLSSGDCHLELDGFPSKRFTALLDDRVLARALGCESPKLYLTHSPRLINNDSDPDGDGYIENSSNLYEIPLIQTGCGKDCDAGEIIEPEITIDGIKVVEFSADRLVANVEVPNKEKSYLVYLDSIHPGWRAMVDGKPADILPANMAFKAVKLTPGLHEVVFEFTGGSKWSKLTIWTNMIVTLVGAFFLFACGLARVVKFFRHSGILNFSNR